jgi:hypothetical protein
MWKGDHVSPFLRNLPTLVVLPALGLFLGISGVIGLANGREGDGYTRLGGALLAAGAFAFVLNRSMKERSPRIPPQDFQAQSGSGPDDGRG